MVHSWSGRPSGNEHIYVSELDGSNFIQGFEEWLTVLARSVRQIAQQQEATGTNQAPLPTQTSKGAIDPPIDVAPLVVADVDATVAVEVILVGTVVANPMVVATEVAFFLSGMLFLQPVMMLLWQSRLELVQTWWNS